MQKNRLDDKSYDMARRVRNLFRHDMFERNRTSNTLSYLAYYDPHTRQILLESSKPPIPDPLPPPSLFTISYYRQANKLAYETRLQGQEELDPHMTYESLYILGLLQDAEKSEMYPEIVKRFEEELPLYLSSPYPEIKEVAIIAAGNKILGKPQQIMDIVKENETMIWVLINHIYERKIMSSALYEYLKKGLPMAYRTVFEMTNNYKDEIIDSILQDEDVLSTIVDALRNPNQQVKSYSLRILGNILAQPDDYSHDLMKFGILEAIYPLLSCHNVELRRQTCWLLSNYVFDNGAASQVLFKNKLKQRLISMLKSEQNVDIKTELYHVFSHLVEYADRTTIYQMGLQERLLDQCEEDLHIKSQELVVVVLNLMLQLVKLGEDFVNEDEQVVNEFAHAIANSNLRNLVKQKTYDNNQTISDISCDIIACIEASCNDGDEDAM